MFTQQMFRNTRTCFLIQVVSLFPLIITMLCHMNFVFKIIFRSLELIITMCINLVGCRAQNNNLFKNYWRKVKIFNQWFNETRTISLLMSFTSSKEMKPIVCRANWLTVNSLGLVKDGEQTWKHVSVTKSNATDPGDQR